MLCLGVRSRLEPGISWGVETHLARNQFLFFRCFQNGLRSLVASDRNVRSPGLELRHPDADAHGLPGRLGDFRGTCPPAETPGEGTARGGFLYFSLFLGQFWLARGGEICPGGFWEQIQGLDRVGSIYCVVSGAGGGYQWNGGGVTSSTHDHLAWSVRRVALTLSRSRWGDFGSTQLVLTAHGAKTSNKRRTSHTAHLSLDRPPPPSERSMEQRLEHRLLVRPPR